MPGRFMVRLACRIALAEERRAMAGWLGLGAIAVAPRGALAGGAGAPLPNPGRYDGRRCRARHRHADEEARVKWACSTS